jgi:hypothetical protein
MTDSERRMYEAAADAAADWTGYIPPRFTHELKVWPEYFDALVGGDKTFEFRKDDREPRFAAGDVLRLREWAPEPMPPEGFDRSGSYTGRELFRRVRYVARSSPLIPDGFCCMSLGEVVSGASTPDHDPDGALAGLLEWAKAWGPKAVFGSVKQPDAVACLESFAALRSSLALAERDLTDAHAMREYSTKVQQRRWERLRKALGDDDRKLGMDLTIDAVIAALIEARVELVSAHRRIASLTSELSQARALTEKERDDLKAELLKTQPAGAE